MNGHHHSYKTQRWQQLPSGDASIPLYKVHTQNGYQLTAANLHGCRIQEHDLPYYLPKKYQISVAFN